MDHRQGTSLQKSKGLRGNNFYPLAGKKMQELCCKWGVIKRYVALILWCLIQLVGYFCYDIPGSLQNNIMAIFNLDPLQFSYLYSVYAWPNIVMCYFGGFFVDRVFGPKLGLIIYIGITNLGMILFVTGANINNFILMLVGRFIIGIGCESTTVTVNYFAVLWFSGKELNMVFAFVMNIGRIGSSIVFESSEPLLKLISKAGLTSHQALGYTLIAMGSVSLIALASSFLVALMDPENKQEEVVEVKNLDPAPVAKLSDVLRFPIQYWLMCIITCLYTSCIYSFLGLSQMSFTTKFHVSDDTANGYVSFFSFFSFVLSPILGILIDKYGRNLSYVTVSIVTGLLAFCFLAFTEASPYVSMSFLAISMASHLCSIWALFSYIIPEHQLGTAYGVVQALLNTMLSIGSVTAGGIANKYGPATMEASIFAIIFIGTVPCILWSWIVDIKYTKLLNMSGKKRTEYLERTLEKLNGSNGNGLNET